MSHYEKNYKRKERNSSKFMFVCAIICEYNPFHRGHE
ncbi:MAG: nucleotidyltransferase family protein, partial [Clostridia bacterium]|nr:nucleotidyltransferase family protein [Clostridia bacterium]